jgi:hypothetical protein
MRDDVTGKDIAGASAGSLVIIALLDVLIAKGTLTIGEVRSVLQNARASVGSSQHAHDVETARVLDWLITTRFPDGSHK